MTSTRATDRVREATAVPAPGESPPDLADLAVRVRGLRKVYGTRPAVDGVDLDVHRGEVLALLGPNGAGKTTIVEVLEGYRRRDAGEVAVLGEDPQRAGRAWRERIGIVLQDAGDLGDVTVGEAVRHFAGYYPNPRPPAEVVEHVGLTASSGKRIGQLSGGQRRRLDVALGILGRPELLFLDEPTTGFDPEARRTFWELILDLAREGTTILLTTHYLDEAEQLADRVAVLASGRLLDVAPPAEVGGRRQRPARVRWLEGREERVEVTAHPTALVQRLASRLGEVPGLAVERPSLEDVYLDLLAAAGSDPSTSARTPEEEQR